MDCNSDCMALSNLRSDVDKNNALLDARTKRVEDGVANFRSFQADVRNFITRADTREEERRRFQEVRDKEIKDALQEHYQKATVINMRLSSQLARKNLLWNIAAVGVSIACLAITITGIIVTNYVVHHTEANPVQMLTHPSEAPQVSKM